MNELFQREDEVFKPNSLLVLLHCVVGKNWADQFFPPPKCFDLSIDHLVFRFMLLFHCILTLMNDLLQEENQVVKPNSLFVLLHCWVGKDWAGPFFPPSEMFQSFYLSFSLLDYTTLRLYLNTYELLQREDEVFKPKTVYWYFYIVWWGNTGPAHSSPPPKCSDLSP